jgi:hypothetical protein
MKKKPKLPSARHGKARKSSQKQGSIKQSAPAVAAMAASEAAELKHAARKALSDAELLSIMDLHEKVRSADALSRGLDAGAEGTELVVNERREADGKPFPMSYSLSHDLRAPLRSMQGHAQLLFNSLNATLDATARTYLQRLISKWYWHCPRGSALHFQHVRTSPFRAAVRGHRHGSSHCCQSRATHGRPCRRRVRNRAGKQVLVGVARARGVRDVLKG